MFQVQIYRQLARETRTWYVSIFCRYIVKTLVIQVKWLMKVILAFFKLTHTSCHCLPLILIYLIGIDYSFIIPWLPYNSKNYACECPMIHRIKPAKLVTYNSHNYTSTLSSAEPSGKAPVWQASLLLTKLLNVGGLITQIKYANLSNIYWHFYSKSGLPIYHRMRFVMVLAAAILASHSPRTCIQVSTWNHPGWVELVHG